MSLMLKPGLPCAIDPGPKGGVVGGGVGPTEVGTPVAGGRVGPVPRWVATPMVEAGTDVGVQVAPAPGTDIAVQMAAPLTNIAVGLTPAGTAEAEGGIGVAYDGPAAPGGTLVGVRRRTGRLQASELARKAVELKANGIGRRPWRVKASPSMRDHADPVTPSGYTAETHDESKGEGTLWLEV
jgi:hypothetical protein